MTAAASRLITKIRLALGYVIVGVVLVPIGIAVLITWAVLPFEALPSLIPWFLALLPTLLRLAGYAVAVVLAGWIIERLVRWIVGIVDDELRRRGR